ncbi:hypothetical protein D3C81_1736130 [compost metagenome]
MATNILAGQFQIADGQGFRRQRVLAWRTAQAGVAGIEGEHALDDLGHRQGAFAVLAQTLGLNPLHARQGRFGAHHFLGRHDAVTQHFPDARAGNVQAVAFVVRAGFRSGVAGAAGAVEHLME